MESMVSTSTKITALLIGLAVVLWLGTTQVTDDTIIQGIVLLSVGIILPTGFVAGLLEIQHRNLV